MATKETVTTEIEIYDLENMKEEVLDPKEEKRMNELREELGLEGLGEILDKEGIIPFRRLSKGEFAMWKEAFPYNHKPERFQQIIPLRILETLKICKDKNYFKSYYIYHTHDVDKDPVLMGNTEHEDNGDWYETGWYLIARWGSSLLEESEVLKMAMTNYKEKIKSDINDKIKECNEALNDLDYRIKIYFETGSKYKAKLNHF